MHIHMHVYMHMTINHEFEKEQGGLYGRIWREERERRNDEIILQSQK